MAPRNIYKPHDLPAGPVTGNTGTPPRWSLPQLTNPKSLYSYHTETQLKNMESSMLPRGGFLGLSVNLSAVCKRSLSAVRGWFDFADLDEHKFVPSCGPPDSAYVFPADAPEMKGTPPKRHAVLRPDQDWREIAKKIYGPNWHPIEKCQYRLAFPRSSLTHSQTSAAKRVVLRLDQDWRGIAKKIFSNRLAALPAIFTQDQTHTRSWKRNTATDANTGILSSAQPEDSAEDHPFSLKGIDSLLHLPPQDPNTVLSTTNHASALTMRAFDVENYYAPLIAVVTLLVFFVLVSSLGYICGCGRRTQHRQKKSTTTRATKLANTNSKTGTTQRNSDDNIVQKTRIYWNGNDLAPLWEATETFGFVSERTPLQVATTALGGYGGVDAASLDMVIVMGVPIDEDGQALGGQDPELVFLRGDGWMDGMMDG